MIHVSDSGLLTIAGGKWTTYRAMAEETVDEAVKVFGLKDRVTNGCITDRVRLIGSEGWSRNMFIGLTQRVCLLAVRFVELKPDEKSLVRSLYRCCQAPGAELWRQSLDFMFVS